MKNTQQPIVRKVRKKQTLVYQGESPRYAIKIVSGLVKAYSITNTADERIVALYGSGDTIPTSWLFDMTPVALYFYETQTECVIELHTKQSVLSDIFSDENQVRQIVKNYTGSQIRLDAVMQSRARDRLAKTLLFLSTKFGVEKSPGLVQIDIMLTQADLGNLSGLTRETTAVELGKLKKEGYISVKSKVYTIARKDLLEVAGEELNEVIV